MFALEKPLNMYSSKELEDIFLRSKSTEVAWEKDDAALCRQRDLIIEDSYVCAHLVSGGRWLLVVLSDGQVCYYDLHSSTMERKHLMEAQIKESDYVGVKLSVDVTEPMPIPSFNLALHVSESHENTSGAFKVIKIWRIDYVIREQTVVGLKAHRLKSLRMHHDIVRSIRGMSLFGRHIAFSAACEPRQEFAFVVNWPDIEEESLDYPRKLLFPLGIRLVISFCFQHEGFTLITPRRPKCNSCQTSA